MDSVASLSHLSGLSIWCAPPPPFSPRPLKSIILTVHQGLTNLVCRGNGLRLSDWQGLLGCDGLAHLTSLNKLAWSPQRRDIVLSELTRVIRREAVAHIDLR